MIWYYGILVLLIFPMCYACIGYIREINVNNLVLPICIGILAFFMGCRAVSVGADTCQYVYGFEQIVTTPWTKLFTTKIYGVGGGYELNFEYGYRLYNKLVSMISENPQAITIANSLLIMSLLGKLIKGYSPYVFLSIWLYITLGIYQTQMNMARNAIAILISYLGCKYIAEHNVIKFLICVTIATLFHSSSVLFIPVYWLVTKTKLTGKKIGKILLLSVVCGLAFSLVRPFFVPYLTFGFGRYFAGNTSKFASIVVGAFHLVIVAIVIFFTDKYDRAKMFEGEAIGVWMLVLEMLFFCIGYDVAAATRMAALFGPYLIIFIPRLIKTGIESKTMRLNVIALIVIMSGVQYIARLQINNIGLTMPYQFFWA